MLVGVSVLSECVDVHAALVRESARSDVGDIRIEALVCSLADRACGFTQSAHLVSAQNLMPKFELQRRDD